MQKKQTKKGKLNFVNQSSSPTMTAANEVQSTESQVFITETETLQPPYTPLSVNIITYEDDLGKVKELIDTLPHNCEVVIVVNEQGREYEETATEQYTDDCGRVIKMIVWKYKLFSFAQVRNIAIENSTREWILAIDSDERLWCNNKDWFGQLSKVQLSIGGMLVGQVGCSLPEDRPNEQGYYAVETLRLFRRHKNIRWIGYAHEQIQPAIDEVGYLVSKSELLLLHIGYNINRERRIKKLERNVTLLNRQLAVYPEQHTQFYRQLLQRDISLLLKEK